MSLRPRASLTGPARGGGGSLTLPRGPARGLGRGRRGRGCAYIYAGARAEKTAAMGANRAHSGAAVGRFVAGLYIPRAWLREAVGPGDNASGHCHYWSSREFIGVRHAPRGRNRAEFGGDAPKEIHEIEGSFKTLVRYYVL